jgi:16S rRNA (guanine527-N7)-methyltransferase
MAQEHQGSPLLRRIGGADDFKDAFKVSPATLARLVRYEQLLWQWQKAVNLVAPRTLKDVWHRHFADSAQLLFAQPAARSWVDVGSGGGFPGLVIAILLAEPADGPARPGAGEAPAPRVTLIESNARKCAFLAEVVRQTDLRARIAVDILSTRCDVAATQARVRGPEVISARALAPLDKLLGMTVPLFMPGTVGVFPKGRDAAAELKAAEKTWCFTVDEIASRTEPEGVILMIRDPAPKSPVHRQGRIAKE